MNGKRNPGNEELVGDVGARGRDGLGFRWSYNNNHNNVFGKSGDGRMERGNGERRVGVKEEADYRRDIVEGRTEGLGGEDDNNCRFSRSFVNAGGLVVEVARKEEAGVDSKNNSQTRSICGSKPSRSKPTSHDILSIGKGMMKSGSVLEQETCAGSERDSGQVAPHSKIASTALETIPTISSVEKRDNYADDWDFLAALNDILRKENFLGESETEKRVNNNWGYRRRHRSYNVPDEGDPFARDFSFGDDDYFNAKSSFSHDEYHGGIPPAPPPMPPPIAPRPPRPTQRKEYIKSRSMNLDRLLPMKGGGCYESSLLALPPSSQSSNGLTLSAPNEFDPGSRPNYVEKGTRSSAGDVNARLIRSDRCPSPTGIRSMAVKHTLLGTGKSTSLDSIYDRINSVAPPPYSVEQVRMSHGGEILPASEHPYTSKGYGGDENSHRFSCYSDHGASPVFRPWLSGSGGEQVEKRDGGLGNYGRGQYQGMWNRHSVEDFADSRYMDKVGDRQYGINNNRSRSFGSLKEEDDLDMPKTEVGAGATEVGKVDCYSGSESKPILPLNVHGGGVKGRIDKKGMHNGSPTVEDCQSSSTASADEEEDTENDEEDGDEDNDDESSTSYETESSEDSGLFPGMSGTDTHPDGRAVNLVIGKATVGNCGMSEVVKIQTSKARPELPENSGSKCADKKKADQKGNLPVPPSNSNDMDSKKALQKMPSMDFKSLTGTLEKPADGVGTCNENNSAEGCGSVFQVKLPESSEDIKIAGHVMTCSADAREKVFGGGKKRSSQSRKNLVLSAGLPPVPPTSPLPSMIFQAPMCNSVYGVNAHDHSSSRHLKLQCGSCSGAGYRNYDVNRFIAQPQSCGSHSVRSILSPVRQTMQTCSNEGTVYSLALEMPVPGSSNLSAAVRRKKQGKKRYPASLPDEELGCICSPFYVSDVVRCACEIQSRSRDKSRREKLWTRASIERDYSIPSPSGNSRNNRHSSYTPQISAGDQAGNADLAETPSKSGAHSIHLSRPTSPQSVKLSDKTSCNECSNRTFPRSLSRGPSSSCRHCHLFCSRGSVGSIGGSLLGLDYEDRLVRLESDKDTLHLQVSVLSDQIEAQTSKIQDLEKMLDDKRNVLETTEEQLQRELVTRSGLETQKLELITEISGLRLKQATLERENLELKGKFGTNCVRSLTDLNYASDKIPPPWNKPPIAGVAKIRDSSPHAYADPNSGRLRLTSMASDNMQSHPPRMQTPPSNASRRVEITPPYGTMPRLNHVCMQPGMTTSLSSGNAASGNKSLMIATKPNSLSSGNLNHIDHSNSNNVFSDFGFESKDSQKSNKGGFTESGNTKPMKILRILGKLRRSNSGALDADAPSANGNEGNFPENKNPFVRGGFRATAAPRLGWGPETSSPRMPDGPITTWDSASVVNWLNYLGLGMYSNEMRRWVKSGQQLLDASPNELEKELGVKNSLHRKKLSLALYFLQHPDEEDNAGRLDYHWVTRWLDDVGLPQYKEAFADARIDGRVLSHLTAEDLINLKVTSLLHHVSLKRGIQILRIHRFHPGCLCRRGSLSEFKKGLTNDPKYVATWTNHRVMEWLKAVDLAEYAPNLRGSGVHGALIVLEPKFNAELLAVLLSIPTNKTLLRRHLCQQFHELCGKAMVEEKRAIQLAPEFLPISLTAKVKHVKKTFPLRKKTPSAETEELLCAPELGSFPAILDSRSMIFPERSEAELSNDKTSNL